MPKQQVHPPEVREEAKKLFLAGYTNAEVSRAIAEKFNGEYVHPDTIRRWAETEQWGTKLTQAKHGALAKIADQRAGSIAKDIEAVFMAYRHLRRKGEVTLGNVEKPFDDEKTAIEALRVGLEGERKILAGLVSVEFIRDVLQILNEEIVDDDTRLRIASRLKKLTIDIGKIGAQ